MVSENAPASGRSRLGAYRRALPWWVLAGVGLGAATGLGLHAAGVRPEEVDRWGLGVPGDLFLRALQMVVVPLVVAAIVTGMSGAGDLRRIGRLGLWTAVFYVGTTALSVLQGLLLVHLIQPGRGVDLSLAGPVPDDIAVQGISFGDFMLGLVSQNPVGDAAAGLAEGRLLPLLLFCVLFGGVLSTLPEKTRAPMDGLFSALYEVMMRVTDLVVLCTPVGVFFLLLCTFARHGTDPFASIGLFGLTVVLGLALHALVVLPLLLKLLGGVSPGRLARAMSPALLTAFSTSSSSATLPLTLECATERAGVPRHVAHFVLPVGATANMDGTALYEAVAALFVAQAYGIHLEPSQQLTVLVLAVLASIGTAAIPSASLVMIAVVLSAVGLPLEGIGLILALDRLLDMARTTVNVWGDASCAAIYAGRERRRTPDAVGPDPVVDR
ncbi:MAG: dicarboxylate/amino acid:cation symporter [Deltaproteobacteria bacterium]|nr:dicarboxylate/amino acid:cation symporter [Deltaproteobacteria bacterium]